MQTQRMARVVIGEQFVSYICRGAPRAETGGRAGRKKTILTMDSVELKI